MSTRAFENGDLLIAMRMNSLEHVRGDLKVSDNAVLQGAHRRDGAGRSADHLLRLVADGDDLLRVGAHVHRNDRGLTDHNALAFNENKGIGGAEVDPNIL